MNELVNGVKYAVGVELCEDVVSFALVSEIGDILFSDKLQLSKNATREVILSILHTSIHTALKEAGKLDKPVSGIGIGTPGIVFNGVVLGGAGNLNGWKNIFLGSVFSKAFDLPVYVNNDVNVKGLAETAYGAARGCSDVLFLTVDTGIEGAVLIDGKLFGGYRNHGTKLGHITINQNGVDCTCGGRGCLDVYASIKALRHQYMLKTGRKENLVDEHCIWKRYNKGEEAAVQCISDHIRYLGQGIASLINIFAPQKVVVGGGISKADRFYVELIQKITFDFAMSDCAANTEIMAAMLGNQAGILGAASLVFNS